MKILEELYYGNISSYNSKSGNETKSKELNGELSEIENQLTELLEGNEKKLFLRYVSLVGEINGTTAVDEFVKGFKIGAKMGVAIYAEIDDSLMKLE